MMPERRPNLPLVEAQAVGRRFERGGGFVTAIDVATCTIEAQDRIALVGPSGSGKSTLLHLMAGIEAATSGRLSWPALGDQSTLRPEKIAFAPQSPSLIMTLDVWQNVALPLRLLGDQDQAPDKARRALDMLGLADLAKKLPGELSGGQMQRVALARAIAARPRLLLADEPTGQLDSQSASQLIETLIAWAAQLGAALVIATHDERFAARMAQRWTLEHGSLSTSGGSAG